MILRRSFFKRRAVTVAKEMLGKYIVHVDRGVKLSGKIVETEAYIGPEDKASHGYNWKRTQRNRVEYMVGGHIYIYLVYGMYWQLNITTGEEGIPECVLIRAVEPVDGIDLMMERRKTDNINNLTNGPGKFCQAFGFNGSHYGYDVAAHSQERIFAISPVVHVEDRGVEVKVSQIACSKRIGIDYAEEWADKPLRFYLKSSPFVSK